jgi:hypothetical protein
VNILTEDLPEAIEIDGTEYKIHSDHRQCIRIIGMFEDVELTGPEKMFALVHMLYYEIPANMMEAARLGVKFLDQGKEQEESEGPGHRLYSFQKDSDLIYAAYRQTHGIDLSKELLHWWVFISLFHDLGSETVFCQLVSLRKRVKTGKATKEERAMARSLGSMFEVEDTGKPWEMIEAERKFMEKVNGRKS